MDKKTEFPVTFNQRYKVSSPQATRGERRGSGSQKWPGISDRKIEEYYQQSYRLVNSRNSKIVTRFNLKSKPMTHFKDTKAPGIPGKKLL